ncbi:MAG TPA: AzlD domain-containing protein [Pseudolabrys sp.]|nr:AzlD domain-containing protein [Pseudolabrys sp.]
MSAELWPYVVLMVIGFLPNEAWRLVGLVLARGLNEQSQIVLWSRAVATAILAGVVAKLIVFASGSLATIPLGVRMTAVAVGFAAFLLIRRSPLAGVLAGEAVLLMGGYFFAP